MVFNLKHCLVVNVSASGLRHDLSSHAALTKKKSLIVAQSFGVQIVRYTVEF